MLFSLSLADSTNIPTAWIHDFVHHNYDGKKDARAFTHTHTRMRKKGHKKLWTKKIARRETLRKMDINLHSLAHRSYPYIDNLHIYVVKRWPELSTKKNVTKHFEWESEQDEKQKKHTCDWSAKKRNKQTENSPTHICIPVLHTRRNLRFSCSLIARAQYSLFYFFLCVSVFSKQHDENWLFISKHSVFFLHATAAVDDSAARNSIQQQQKRYELFHFIHFCFLCAVRFIFARLIWNRYFTEKLFMKSIAAVFSDRLYCILMPLEAKSHSQFCETFAFHLELKL